MKITIQNKMLDFNALAEYCKVSRSKGESIALCHGCFDPVHLGHIHHFLEASEIADKLIVTITPDVYVNKGSDRPFFSAEQRLLMIAALECVDMCAINLWPTASETIRKLIPDYYVKGIDYKETVLTDSRLSEEVRVVHDVGGIMYFTKSEKLSSTELVNKGIIPIIGAQNDHL